VDTDGDASDVVKFDRYSNTITDPASLDAVRGAALPVGVVPMVVFGDSFAGNSDRNYQVTSCTVSAGVATIVVPSSVISASNRLIYPGCLISLSNYADENMNLSRAPVLSVTPAGNSFAVACPGVADGAAAVGSIAGFAMLQNHSAPADTGVPVWLNRLTGGALQLLHNAGRPGYRLPEICTQAQWDKRVKPHSPRLVVFLGGYNDLNQISLGTAGYSAASMVAALENLCRIAVGSGTMLVVPSLVAPAGFTGANVAQANAALIQYNAQAKPLVESYGHAWVDALPYTVTPTGAQRSGLFQTDNIHPASELARIYARLIVAHPKVAVMLSPRRLCASYYDNVANSPGVSTNIVRAMPVSGNTGGSVGGVTSVAGPVPAGASGTSGVSAGYTVACSGTAGQAWTSTDADNGQSVQWANAIPTANGHSGRITYTLTPADIVPGSTLYLAAKLWLTTAHNGSNQSPNGQNVIQWGLRLVLTIDGQAYTFFSAAGGMPNDSTADAVGQVEVFDGLTLPAGASCSAAQVDYFVQFGGAGNVYMGMSQPSVRTTLTL
jgi:GDSL-like Lipase/Acylhydrolase family